jgi:hypothetical protein
MAGRKTDKSVPLKERQAIIKELKERLEDVLDEDERREIVREFVAEKAEKGMGIVEEDLYSLVDTKPLGRPRGPSVALEKLIPETRIRISALSADVSLPQTKQGNLVRNLVLSEMGRDLISAEVAWRYKRLVETKGADRMDLDELTKLQKLIEQTNANSQKTYDAVYASFKEDVERGDIADINLADFSEGLQTVIVAYMKSKVGGGKPKTDDDLMKLAEEATSSVTIDAVDA